MNSCASRSSARGQAECKASAEGTNNECPQKSTRDTYKKSQKSMAGSLRKLE